MRFTVESGGVRARAVAFGMPRLPDGCADGLDATFGLELNEWQRRGRAAAGAARRGRAAAGAGRAPRHRSRCRARAGAQDERDRDRRGLGVAGTLGMLAASGERVLALCADAPRWKAALEPRLGGFTVAGWEAMDEAARYDHVVALEPPPFGLPDVPVVLAWGEAEGAVALAAHRYRWELRPHVAALYRALRDGTDLAIPRAGRGDSRPRGARPGRGRRPDHRRDAHAARALVDVRRGTAPACRRPRCLGRAGAGNARPASAEPPQYP